MISLSSFSLHLFSLQLLISTFYVGYFFEVFVGVWKGVGRKQEREDKENIKGRREREWWEGKKKAGRKAIKGSLINSVKAGPQES